MSFRGVLVSGSHDPIKRECYDCLHCEGAVAWWCKSKAAVKRRGTTIPGTDNCPEWEPCITKKDLGWWGLGPYDIPVYGRGRVKLNVVNNPSIVNIKEGEKMLKDTIKIFLEILFKGLLVFALVFIATLSFYYISAQLPTDIMGLILVIAFVAIAFAIATNNNIKQGRKIFKLENRIQSLEYKVRDLGCNKEQHSCRCGRTKT